MSGDAVGYLILIGALVECVILWIGFGMGEWR